MNTHEKGTRGEQLAEEYFRSLGYEIAEKNFRCKLGEIDLIARREWEVVFVEVKYRRTKGSGYAQEMVPMSKQRKICRTSDYYRMKYGLTERYSFRFDVIAINGQELKHIENAFPYL